jgi:1-aminocyclopropane-1-carboxylate deaminase/D-cysteine desulfhydrase-like pyridoxal-dependent ACC family enzyme
MTPTAELPLVERFPAVGQLPRARLGNFPTAVVAADALAPGLWLKREDHSAEPLGGNKVRALEFLLGPVRAGERVVTVGAAGSTHALATVTFARQLGAIALCFRWRQEMNDVASRVAARITSETGISQLSRTVIGAYAKAFVARMRGAHWIPAGGTTPLGVLGQVNAALELARQVQAGLMPAPDRVVLPLGTGGTAAGLALGLAIAGLECEIVGVRVVPRVVANHAHVRRLIDRTARLIERLTSEHIARPPARSFRIEHGFFGGAYGRATDAGEAISRRCLEQIGILVDPTYGAKALAAAVRIANDRGGVTLFWLSFDGRWMRRERTGTETGGVVALG